MSEEIKPDRLKLKPFSRFCANPSGLVTHEIRLAASIDKNRFVEATRAGKRTIFTFDRSGIHTRILLSDEAFHAMATLHRELFDEWVHTDCPLAMEYIAEATNAATK